MQGASAFYHRDVIGHNREQLLTYEDVVQRPESPPKSVLFVNHEPVSFCAQLLVCSRTAL
jgi:hypothetical protein